MKSLHVPDGLNILASKNIKNALIAEYKNIERDVMGMNVIKIKSGTVDDLANELMKELSRLSGMPLPPPAE